MWRVDSSRKSLLLASKLNESWEKRQAAAAAWNTRLEAGAIKPRALRKLWWRIRARGRDDATRSFEDAWIEKSRRVPSIVWSLSDVFGIDFWLGGAHGVLHR